MEEKEQTEKRDRELLQKAYGVSLKKIKELLLKDKTKIKESKLKDQVKKEATLVIDMLANVLDSEDKDALEYAFIAYKYVAKSMPFRFFGRVNKINKLIKDIANAI
jgi:hypothetical protein